MKMKTLGPIIIIIWAGSILPGKCSLVSGKKKQLKPIVVVVNPTLNIYNKVKYAKGSIGEKLLVLVSISLYCFAPSRWFFQEFEVWWGQIKTLMSWVLPEFFSSLLLLLLFPFPRKCPQRQNDNFTVVVEELSGVERVARDGGC